jgi:thiamine biosynthesis lipoprotein
VALIWLANAALASSGVDYRRWLKGGTPMHHIIDPRTGAPAATDLLSVTIYDSSAARAEAWATAILVHGKEASVGLLEARRLAALLVGADQQMVITAPLLPHMIQLEAHFPANSPS